MSRSSRRRRRKEKARDPALSTPDASLPAVAQPLVSSAAGPPALLSVAFKKVKAHRKMIVAILGGLIGFPAVIKNWLPVAPRLNVSVGAPAERAQPFSVGFTIKNDGWLAASDVVTACYVHRVELGKTVIESSGLSGAYSKTIELAGQGGEHTVRCSIAVPGSDLRSADIAIVADYKGLVGRSRDCWRYAAARGDPWQWQVESCADIRPQVDEALRTWGL
jgi:hypothetical protein